MIDEKIRKAIDAIEAQFPEQAGVIRDYITDNYGIFFERGNSHRTAAVGMELSEGCAADALVPMGKKGALSAVGVTVLSVNGEDAVVKDAGGNIMSVPVRDVCPVISSDDYKISFRLSDSIRNGGKDAPCHALIAGENYYAMKELSRRYGGKVDCIYIDPPFNTGATNWKYNNKYMNSDDVYRHSAWLSFMEERLLIAKQLLNPECSVLIAAIDEKENLRLGMLLERIFEGERMQMVSVCTNMAGSTRKNMFSRTDETYFFVMIGSACPQRLPLTDEWMTGNKSVLLNKRLVWESFKRRTGVSYRENAPAQFYPIFVTEDLKKFHSIGESLPPGVDRRNVVPPEGTVAVFPIRSDGSEGIWQMTPESAREMLRMGYIRIGSANEQSVVSISYLKKGQREKLDSGIFDIVGRREDGSVIESENNNYSVPRTCGTQWRISAHNASVFGTPLVNTLVGVNRFQFPKSVYAVHDAMMFFIGDKKDALILDFFAGSATTMHAVSLLNSEDGGKRRCICITNNEVGQKEAGEMLKRGIRPQDAAWIEKGVAHSIAWTRIRNYILGKDIKGNPLKGTYMNGAPMSEGFRENADLYDMEYDNGSK